MWLDKNNDKDNELGAQSQSSNPSVGAGAGDSGTSAGGTTAGNMPANTPISNTPQTTQKFATVQDYLKTNQPQAEDLGQKFTGSLDTTYGQQTGAIDTAANQAKNDIASNTINYNPDLTNTAVKDPTKIANDPNQLDAFNKQWNAQYSGPQSFETSNSYGTAASALNNANQIKGELGTTGGREQLIQDQFGVYGQGNKGLDQALLQSSSAFPKVQEQEKKFGSIQDYLNQQSQAINPLATKAAADAASAQSNTRNAFATNLTDFQNTINNETKAAQDNYQNKTSAIQNDLKVGNAEALQKDLASAGIDPQNIPEYLKTLNSVYRQNPDLSNYFTGNAATDINSANVATPEEYAKAAAYQKLTGTDYSGVLNPAQADQSGKLPSVGNSVNAPDLNSYLKNQVTQRDKDLLNNVSTATHDKYSDGKMSYFSKSLGLPDFSDYKNWADTATGQKLAQNFIDLQKRTNANVQDNTPGQKGTPLQQIYNDAVGIMQRNSKRINNGNKTGTYEVPPELAGVQSFVDTVSKALYPDKAASNYKFVIN